jgi:hypothetical protein
MHPRLVLPISESYSPGTSAASQRLSIGTLYMKMPHTANLGWILKFHCYAYSGAAELCHVSRGPCPASYDYLGIADNL